MKNYGDITLKYLKENKKRTLFTMIGIIVSLSLISGIGFLICSFRDTMIQNAKNSHGDFEVLYRGVDANQYNILKNDVDLYNVGLSMYKGNHIVGENGKETVDIQALDDIALNNILKKALVEGSYPKNMGELIVDKRSKESLGYKIGDEVSFTDEENKTEKYKITGFYTSTKPWAGYYEATTLINDTKNLGNKGNALVSIKDSRDKVNIAKEKAELLKIDKGQIEYNNDLLVLSGNSTYGGINSTITIMAVIVMSIIIVATIFLIYNAINISVTERIGQFGILRSIGATPNQIRNIVLREGLIMCFISIPFGILFGFLGVATAVKLLEVQLENIIGASLNIVFYPQVIVISSIIGIVTIFIAAYGPATSAGKASPIDILKNNGNVSKEKIKYYNGKIIKKIFGLEGWIAYKNIRKNSRRFIITILSLSVSLIMFIVFTTVNIKQRDELQYLRREKVGQGTIYSHEKSEAIEKELKNLNGISKIYSDSSIDAKLLFKTDNINKDYLNDSYEIEKMGDGYSLYNNGAIYFYNDTALEEIKSSEQELSDNGLILINNTLGDNGKGQYVNTAVTNYKVGDKIEIPKTIMKLNSKFQDFNELYDYKNSSKLKEDIEEDIKNKDMYAFEIKGIIEKNIFNPYDRVGFIVSKKVYEKIAGDIYDDRRVKFDFGSDDEKLIEKTSKEVEIIANKYGTTYINGYNDAKMQEERSLVINIFIYGFITLVTIIGIVNVLNTIVLSILLKKREFGTLEIIGMSRLQLIKMVILEGVLHGIIASILGGVISLALIKLIFRALRNGFTISSHVAFMPFIIGFIGCILITLIASLIPLKNFSKISLVDTIRNEE